MKLKLLIGVASFLGIMTVVGSAQAPRAAQDRPNAPLIVPSYSAPAFSYPRTEVNMLGNIVAPSSEEANLARASADLVRQFSKVEGDKKEDIKAKLSTTLNKQFDLRQKRHESEIAVLESQLNKLKELVRKRQENRGEIINQRLSQLLREAQGLGW